MLAVALSACSGGGGDGKGALGADAGAKVAVNLTGDNAKAGEQVKVTATEGTLENVSVKDGEGDALAGKIAGDGRTWTSDRVAAPGTTYTVETKDDRGRTGTQRFATQQAGKVNKLDFNFKAGSTVGTAMPVSITFDHPVKNKAAVEKQLKLTTDNGTKGSWGWYQDQAGRQRVDWRPQTYWKPGTKVKLDADLKGVDSGADGGWFVRDYDNTFTIGKDQQVEVDLDSKRLQLVRDGQVVKSIPVAAGTPGGEKASWDGKMVLMRKEGTIRMTSQSVGLGDAYDKMVRDSMRLTDSGMYVHAAPWNAGNYGRVNNSSGCVGMSDADADWLYAQVQPGDLVEVTGPGSKGQAKLGNGYAEWNMSWTAWQKLSALTPGTH
nr:Ig-like domain-containing protein [Streptomyces indicus]